MKCLSQLGVVLQPLQELGRHIELRRTLHPTSAPELSIAMASLRLTFDGFAFRVDARRISESDLPGSLHIFRLLHEDVIGVV